MSTELSMKERGHLYKNKGKDPDVSFYFRLKWGGEDRSLPMIHVFVDKKITLTDQDMICVKSFL